MSRIDNTFQLGNCFKTKYTKGEKWQCGSTRYFSAAPWSSHRSSGVWLHVEVTVRKHCSATTESQTPDETQKYWFSELLRIYQRNRLQQCQGTTA